MATTKGLMASGLESKYCAQSTMIIFYVGMDIATHQASCPEYVWLRERTSLHSRWNDQKRVRFNGTGTTPSLQMKIFMPANLYQR